MPKPEYIPKKVLTVAHQRGIHNDCLVAGPEKSCDSCLSLLNQVMDSFYGHLSTEETKMAILSDLLEDALRA